MHPHQPPPAPSHLRVPQITAQPMNDFRWASFVLTVGSAAVLPLRLVRTLLNPLLKKKIAIAKQDK